MKKNKGLVTVIGTVIGFIAFFYFLCEPIPGGYYDTHLGALLINKLVTLIVILGCVLAVRYANDDESR